MADTLQHGVNQHLSEPTLSPKPGLAMPLSRPLLRITLIGQMTVRTDDDVSVLPTGRKTRALLAILALSAPRPVLRGKLAEMLWSKRPEEQARASLRQELHRLQEALTPVARHVLVISRDQVMMRQDGVQVDVELLLRASAEDPSALALLGGELLEDLDRLDPVFNAWLATERERLGDRARRLGETLLQRETDPHAVIPAAQRLLGIDRTHEGAWRALMNAYAALGERGMAIQAYERCRAALGDQLDASPSGATEQLLDEIKSGLSRPSPANGRHEPVTREASPPDGSLPVLPVGKPPHREPEFRDPDRPSIGTGNDIGGPAPIGNSLTADFRRYPPSFNPPQTAPAGSRGGARSSLPGGGTAESAPKVAEVIALEARHVASGRRQNLSWRAGGGPCVGVLPLTRYGEAISASAPELAIADELTAALVRFRWLAVMSPAALGRLPRPSQDGGAAYAREGLDYVVDGTVQRSGQTIRVSIHLLSLAAAPHVVWSRRFDGLGSDVLELQDRVAAETAAQLDSQLHVLEGQAVDQADVGGAADGESRYATLLLAMRLMGRLDVASFTRAGEWLRRAVAGPPVAVPHAWTALWHVLSCDQAWAEDAAAARDAARQHADRAVALDPSDARVLTIAGHVRARAEGRLRDAMALHDRALHLNPDLAMAWEFSALTLAYLGRQQEAERHLQRCQTLDALGEVALFPGVAVLAVAAMRDDAATSVELGRNVTEARPNFRPALGLYLSALGNAGLAREAAQVRMRLRASTPGLSVDGLVAEHPFVRDTDRRRFENGLRAAGLD